MLTGQTLELCTAHLVGTSAARSINGDQVFHSCVDVELRLVKLLGHLRIDSLL